MARRLSHHDYTVGWVCALPDELTAAQEMLDEEHQDLPPNLNDSNIYTLGSIGGHNVVLACLPAGQTGNNPAGAVALQMKNTFPAIRFGLMVGIGGGVPSNEADIRLGDVVVSQPGNGHGGVVQYDFGKATPGKFKRTGFLNAPPTILLAAVTKLRSNLTRQKSSLSPHLSKLGNLPMFSRDQAGIDQLFEAKYHHSGEDNCLSCAAERMIQRKERISATPMIHYGTIASGNQVMRDGVERDQISSEFGGVLCFKMEAASLMNTFPCLVICGICDYADSHKNERWQPYAGGTAAAYAKELLGVIPAAEVVKAKTVDKALQDAKHTLYLPLQRNYKFVDRSAELDTLKQKLFVRKDCQKTQVALQFVYSVKADCPEFSIFWVQALSMDTFELGCREIAGILGIRQGQENSEDVKILLQQHLSTKTAGKWLLIVDNADDLDLLCGTHQTEGLLAFLPESDDGLTIFTTQHGTVAQYLTGSDERMGLLEKSLVRKSPSDDSESATNLLTELEDLPLAITQAAAYINTNKSSISEYLCLLKKTEQDAVALISTDFGDHTRYRNLPNSVSRTWTITFNKILERDTWRAIPYSILPAAYPEARLAGAIGTLCSYSFLERRGDGTKLDMHRLVHLATRIIATLKHLSKVFPSYDYTNRYIWRDYLAHVARKDKHCQDTEENSNLCLKIGKNLAQNNADRLASQHELAIAYEANGQVKGALQLLEHIVAIKSELLTEKHPNRLASEHELAIAYQANGQVKEAVKLLEHIVAIESEVLTDNHSDRLASQRELAIAYQANKQVKEAVKLLEDVVAIQSESLAEDHPDRLASQHALAIAYKANGQVKKAVKLLECVAAIRSEALAENHPDRLASQHTLAGAYQANGQVKEAVKLLEDVVVIQSESLAEDHPDRLASQHALAIAEVLAEHHPSRLVSERALAAVYEDLMETSKT
ncbi:kinesin light chain [Aspergillus floccosus]